MASNIPVRCQPRWGGIGAPQTCSNRARSSSFSTCWKPGSRSGRAPMSPPPWTLFWPRSRLTPHPYRPTCPRRPARVDGIEPGPGVDAREHMMKEDRMRLPGIAPPEEDDIRLLDLLIRGRPAAHSEDRRQTDDAGGVSGPVAAVDVVAADDRP